MSFELFISRRYLKSKPNQAIIALITLLSIIGVTIGVTALIVVIGVMAGFETDLKARIMGIEPHLVIKKNDAPIANYTEVIRTAHEHQGVRAAWPMVELQVILRSDTRVTGATIKGVDPDDAGRGLGIQSLGALKPATPDTTGAQPSGPDIPPIVLGRDLARTLGLIKDDTLFVVSPRGTLAPIGYVPLMKKFKVVDYFETGMYEYDGSLAFVNLADAQGLAHLKSAASAIEIRVADLFQAASIGHDLVAVLGAEHGFQDWMELNKNLFSALKLEKAGMFLALTLIILVATFSIASSLVMMVMEKTKDIAILRTLGATRRTIRKVFVFQGMLIGCIGTVSGVLIGTSLCYLQKKYHLITLPGDVYYITALPVNLQSLDVVMVAASALTICFLATLYPAHLAAQLEPVEAIRYG